LDLNDYRDKLVSLINGCGKTQAEIADESGLSQGLISQLSNKKRNLTMPNILAVLKVANCSLADFFSDGRIYIDKEAVAKYTFVKGCIEKANEYAKNDNSELIFLRHVSDDLKNRIEILEERENQKNQRSTAEIINLCDYR